MVIGSMGLTQKTKFQIWIGVAALWLWIWNFRNNLVLIGHKIFMFYRYSIWRPNGFSYGCWFYCRTSGKLWLLGAHDSWQSLRLFLVGLCGSILVDFGMLSCLLSFYLLVDTRLNLKWSMIRILVTSKLCYKRLGASVDAKAGVYPHFKKRINPGQPT